MEQPSAPQAPAKVSSEPVPFQQFKSGSDTPSPEPVALPDASSTPQVSSPPAINSTNLSHASSPPPNNAPVVPSSHSTTASPLAAPQRTNSQSPQSDKPSESSPKTSTVGLQSLKSSSPVISQAGKGNQEELGTLSQL